MKNVFKRKLSRLVVITFLLLFVMTSCVLAQSARTGSGSGTDAVTSASMPEPDKSTGENVKGKKVKIRGTVVIYGNEPHTYAGIRTEDGKKVYAVYPVEADQKIRALQGYLVAFKVILLDKPAGEGSLYLKDGTVRPMSWKIVD